MRTQNKRQYRLRDIWFSRGLDIISDLEMKPSNRSTLSLRTCLNVGDPLEKKLGQDVQNG